MELLSYLNPLSFVSVSLFTTALLYLRDEYIAAPKTATEPLAPANISQYAALAIGVTFLAGLMNIWLQISTVSFVMLGLIVLVSLSIALIGTTTSWQSVLRHGGWLVALIAVAFSLLYFWPW